MSVTNRNEPTILDSVVPNLLGEGFEVYVQPGPELLPDFMKTYEPDAIAYGKSQKLVVDVATARHRHARGGATSGPCWPITRIGSTG